MESRTGTNAMNGASNAVNAGSNAANAALGVVAFPASILRKIAVFQHIDVKANPDAADAMLNDIFTEIVNLGALTWSVHCNELTLTLFRLYHVCMWDPARVYYFIMFNRLLSPDSPTEEWCCMPGVELSARTVGGLCDTYCTVTNVLYYDDGDTSTTTSSESGGSSRASGESSRVSGSAASGSSWETASSEESYTPDADMASGQLPYADDQSVQHEQLMTELASMLGDMPRPMLDSWREAEPQPMYSSDPPYGVGVANPHAWICNTAEVNAQNAACRADDQSHIYDVLQRAGWQIPTRSLPESHFEAQRLPMPRIESRLPLAVPCTYCAPPNSEASSTHSASGDNDDEDYTDDCNDDCNDDNCNDDNCNDDDDDDGCRCRHDCNSSSCGASGSERTRSADNSPNGNLENSWGRASWN
jgi:hypothetical protein